MDSPNISNDQKLIISGDSEQGNGSVYTHIISDLTEKIESLQSEWQKLKSVKDVANMSSVQSDLNKIKAGMKVIDSAIQSTKDLIKNSDKKNSEASNQIRALKEEIERRFSVITKASEDDRSVGDKDLAKLKNEIVLICSKGMGQLNDRMEPIRNDVKNLEEALRKEKEKIQALTQSTNSIKNQRKSNEKKQAKIENSIKQFSSEILHLRAELVSEQQKNVILENRVLTLESKFAEILLRNDVCLKSNENRCYETTNTALISKKTSLEEPTFARNTCEFTSLVPPNKVKSPQLIDMELIEFETYFEETDNNSKELQDQTFNAVTKSEYHSNQTSHVYSGPEDVRHDLLQKVKDFPEKKLSIFSDNTKSDEPVDLSLSSGAGKKETLSYLEKAHEYLQSLQLEGIFAVTNEENISNSQSQKTEEREFDKEKTVKKKTKENEEVKDTILNDKIEWKIRKIAKPMGDNAYQSRVFYSGKPGYRLQLRAKIDRPKGEMFLCLRVLKGVYDELLEWPCRQSITIKISDKMPVAGAEYCFIPEKNALNKPTDKVDNICTNWAGPYHIWQYVDAENLVFDICLG